MGEQVRQKLLNNFSQNVNHDSFSINPCHNEVHISLSTICQDTHILKLNQIREKKIPSKINTLKNIRLLATTQYLTFY